MKASALIILTLFSVLAMNVIGQKAGYPKNNPIELGKVSWLRNYNEAIAAAKQKELPVLILFQEVPGCSNCTKFGNEIMSHPLVVEAIETCFIPLCIYNNQSGHDSEILKKYNEPSWNNPVIRIVDHKGLDLVSRQPDFRSMSKTLASLAKGITASGHEVPTYLDLMLEEADAGENGNLTDVYFSMYCFWSGEKEIGGLDGVLSTEAGYMHGQEVVRVSYRPDRVKLADLYQKAGKKGCADDVYGSVRAGENIVVKPAGPYRKDKEDKYYIYGSAYKTIPMTELQKMKVNRALGTGRNPDIYLSPRQLGWLNSANTQSHLSDKIETVWWKS